MSEASEETRVGIKAAFPVKKRELNGLNRVAAYLNDNRAERVPIVGYVEFTKHTDTITGDELTVALVVVEPVVNAQGRSVKGYAEDVRRMIEDMRKSAGKPPVADTLFDAGEKKALDTELDGQIEAVDRDQAAGVPEKSGEELAAERAEGVPAADLDVDAAADRAKDAVVEAAGAVAAADAEKGGGKTTGQKAFEKDVVAGFTGGRKPRGATVRPTSDPFTPAGAE